MEWGRMFCGSERWVQHDANLSETKKVDKAFSSVWKGRSPHLFFTFCI